MRSVPPIVVLVCALAAPLPADEPAARPYAPGERLEAIELEDQHGVSHRLDGTGRQVLFSADMGAGGLIKEALASDGAARLERARTAYISDVSGMPALVRRLFALPGLRRRPYPIWLDIDGDRTARFPFEAGKVTLLVLDELELREVRHLGSVNAITAALAPAE